MGGILRKCFPPDNGQARVIEFTAPSRRLSLPFPRLPSFQTESSGRCVTCNLMINLLGLDKEFQFRSEIRTKCPWEFQSRNKNLEGYVLLHKQKKVVKTNDVQ